MHPAVHAERFPKSLAVVVAGSGEQRTYAQLEAASNRAAQLFRRLGLKAGDTVALLLENSIGYLEICWAAQRAGLYLTPIAVHLRPDEIRYIVNDSGSCLLITSASVAPAAALLEGAELQRMPGLIAAYSVGAPLANARDWNAALASCPAERIADESAGQVLPYSSGTTGRPKGVKQALTGGPAVADSPLARLYMQLYHADRDSIFLSPGPLYHIAPLAFCMSVHRVGGTVVLMEKFDAEPFLAAVEQHAVTHTQMVPTMFVRLLKLPAATRARYTQASLRYAIHAAAPCPVAVKRNMIDWWGPVLHEYYGGTEAIGSTAINSAEWLRKPGSVGKANWGELHVCDDNGNELSRGATGLIYFGGAARFEYHNDAAKTAESRHPLHADWATLGDIGHVDDDGYLFLSDRRSFMIISGGVNIYPQETENVLVMHPKVADAAVIGVPNDEFGEEVKAIVQPLNWEDAGDALAQELIALCRSQLSPVKCPRSLDFDAALPREANGKLYKKRLRERYWPQ
jgi:long-chain acyl-CoA synthetase